MSVMSPFAMYYSSNTATIFANKFSTFSETVLFHEWFACLARIPQKKQEIEEREVVPVPCHQAKEVGERVSR